MGALEYITVARQRLSATRVARPHADEGVVESQSAIGVDS
jgi:hypothetical protein